MRTYRLDLWFREQKGPAAGNPISHVFVKRPLAYEYSNGDSAIFLTPREFDPESLGVHIDRLIAELEEIKAQAARKYAEHPKKPHSK